MEHSHFVTNSLSKKKNEKQPYKLLKRVFVFLRHTAKLVYCEEVEKLSYSRDVLNN